MTPTLTRFYDLVNKTAQERLDPGKPAEEQPSLEHRQVAAFGAIADGGGARSKTRLYVHLSPDDELGFVERLGPVTVATIQTWLTTSRFTLQPVLDLRRTDAVDQYEPPEWMRELVILRDRTCVHPNCTKDARDCDLDHIEAFVEMDDGGPPGQTRPTTSRRCVDDTTGPRPTAAGPTSTTPTAATSGSIRSDGSTRSSDPRLRATSR